MKHVTTTCDRCKRPIEADGTVIEATAGGLRRRRGPIAIDLCSSCCTSLVSWLDDFAREAPAEAAS